MSASQRSLPGRLVTFEGGDGCGKSTHSEFLERLLGELGHEVVHVREPGGTRLGESFRGTLLDPSGSPMSPRAELLIYEAARAQLIDEVVIPALEDGKLVICDRFTDSTIAYQGNGRGLDIGLIERLNSFATDSVVPDVTLLLHCADRAEKKGRVDRREGRDRIELAGDGFHSRVIEGFLALADYHSDRIALIDTSGPHSETAWSIVRAVDAVVPGLADQASSRTDLFEEFDAEHDPSSDRGDSEGSEA